MYSCNTVYVMKIPYHMKNLLSHLVCRSLKETSQEVTILSCDCLLSWSNKKIGSVQYRNTAAIWQVLHGSWCLVPRVMFNINILVDLTGHTILAFPHNGSEALVLLLLLFFAAQKRQRRVKVVY